jgi:hypothetical protein
MRKLAAILAVVLSIVSSLPRTAHADAPALQTAVGRARDLHLARTTSWRRLLFYRPSAQGRWESHIAGTEFFLAAGGKTSPEAELEATLAAFFAPFAEGAEDAHAICRFPARFRWLDEQLHLRAQLLRAPSCPALDHFVRDLDAESASFVYAANFLDNPVSALGHAFLRIKKKNAPASPNADDEVRDHGIDYSAAADTKNPLLYVWKGLTGQFPGAFRVRSYEEMLREYAGYEDRDLWQYDLSLRPAETELLVLHLWELARSRLDYYYLTENCAYQALALVDAAAPRLDLADQFKLVVLPLDAVKALKRTPGLVSGIVYRPSVRRVLRDAMDKLAPGEDKLVSRLVKNSDAALPAGIDARSAARVLDTAALAIDARWSAGMIDGKNPQALRARARVMERRAAFVGVPPAPLMTQAPRIEEPHKSHDSMRVLLGTGLTSPGGTGFATLGYRLVLHDLADPADGEPELLQLQFLDVRARYDYGRRKLFLDGVTFAELLALKPFTRFEKELSWHVRAFGSTLHDRGAPGVFAHGLDGAIGATLATENEHAALFVMASTFVVFSSALDGIGNGFVRVGVGPYGGLRVRLPLSTVALVTGSVSYLPGEDLKSTFDLRAVLRTRLATDVAVGLEGALQPRGSEALLASYLYF